MTLAELNPDVVLAGLLDGKVEVQTSATKRRAIKCYADGKRPNKGLADEFLTVVWNGAPRARQRGGGAMMGDLALSVYCKTQTDGTVKTQRVKQMLGQIENLIEAAGPRVTHPYWFRIDPQQVITPTTPNMTTGYSTTVINVEWREV